MHKQGQGGDEHDEEGQKSESTLKQYEELLTRAQEKSMDLIIPQEKIVELRKELHTERHLAALGATQDRMVELGAAHHVDNRDDINHDDSNHDDIGRGDIISHDDSNHDDSSHDDITTSHDDISHDEGEEKEKREVDRLMRLIEYLHHLQQLADLTSSAAASGEEKQKSRSALVYHYVDFWIIECIG